MPLQEDEAGTSIREIEAIDPQPGVKLFLHNPAEPMEWDRLTVALVALDASILMVDMLADFKTWERRQRLRGNEGR